ncbi:MAG: sulfatase-like hydrolase/transferase [Bacteroidales bacterium]|nr:sulfatase-like hydrolase/transferase [Bacteroidales bacterium]
MLNQIMKLLRRSILPIILIAFLSCSANKERPNIVFIMMDDFGYSQIAYNSGNIGEQDYDPLFFKHVKENGDYNIEQALEFSGKATPTLSRMAKDGVIFSNAFTSSNLCAPSRIGIATGIHQNRWGIYRNVDCEAHGLKPGSHLAERLKEMDFSTAHIGKWHVGSRDQSMVPKFMQKHGIKDSAGIYPSVRKYPKVLKDLNQNGYMGSTVPEHHALNNGFDYYYGYNMWESPFYNASNVWDGFKHAGKNPKYNTDLFTDKALSFMEKSIDKGKAFYVQLHFHAVHAPLDPKAPDIYYNKFDSESFILNNFYAHVYAVDENIRRIEKFLKENGQADNTIFVFTSDNGGAIGGRSCIPGNAPYRGHKGMYLLGGIKVPLFFYWPDGIEEPQISKQLVSAMDILPTVINAAGGKLPDNLDGKSLLPILEGKSNEAVREYLLWSGIHARAWGFMSRTAFNPTHKSREKAPYAWVVIKDGFVLRTVAETASGLYKEIPNGLDAQIELYSLASDPGEKEELSEQLPQKVVELKSIWENEAKLLPPPYKVGLDKWMKIIPSTNKYLKK